MEQFDLASLEHISKIIGCGYTGYEITGLFKKMGRAEIIHDGNTKWKFLCDVFEKLQSQESNPDSIIKFIETACNPKEFINDKEGYDAITNDLNEILEFYALNVNSKGNVITISEKKETIDSIESEDHKLFVSRNLHHEVTKHATNHFLQQNYFDALDECCKAFDKYVSEKAKSDKSGIQLMSSVLSPDNGTLKLNQCNTATEKNQQNGLKFLCMGLISKIRNPMEHEPQHDFQVGRQDALDILSLISYLYREIDKCTCQLIQK